MATKGPRRTTRKPVAKAPSKLQAALDAAAEAADEELEGGRELAIVLTKLEEAALWAGRALDK